MGASAPCHHSACDGEGTDQETPRTRPVLPPNLTLLHTLSPCPLQVPGTASLPTRGPGLHSYVRATAQAGSGLIPTSPREMFARSGIYSHRLWIKQRMGIIFPVGILSPGPVTEEWLRSFLLRGDSGLGVSGTQRLCPERLQ